MQYLCYSACKDVLGVDKELRRLADAGFITEEEVKLVAPGKIAAFFGTEIGNKLLKSENVLREFKFSILDDAAGYDPEVNGEQILLQGVVDCAIIDDDGITVIDFKTDRVTEETLPTVAQHYRPQVTAYAEALKRIYQKPIKEVALYFFEAEQFVMM
jgi:ATP-dependent helicase/nuclease subunit A